MKTLPIHNTKPRQFLPQLVKLREICCIGLLAFLMQGCGNILEGCTDCEFSRQTVNEFNLLGVTISRQKKPLPDSVGEQYHDSLVYPHVTGKIHLFFSPLSRESTVDPSNPEQLQSIGQSYRFTYSRLIEDEFIEFDPGPYVNTAPLDVGSSLYSGFLSVNSQSAPLHGEGNYVLSVVGFIAPAEATHVELWYQEDLAMERELVRRVELTSLTAWNKYFKPLIANNLMM